MKTIPYYITYPSIPLPKADRIAYVDGPGYETYRPGQDIELSHWHPNRTPFQYKAGTSTESCLKFLEDPLSPDYDLIVNNHNDIDGLLSVFALAYPSVALNHKDILITTAEMGDFWGWGEGVALALFHDLSLLLQNSSSNFYEDGIALTLKILEGHISDTSHQAEQILLDQSEQVERNKIQRSHLSPHLVAYLIPKSSGLSTLTSPQKIIDDTCPLWLHVINKKDKESMHLMIHETEKGYLYYLTLPSYAWADTVGLWLPEGIDLSPNQENSLTFKNDVWSNLFSKLSKLDADWRLFSEFGFSAQNPLPFPAIGGLMDRKGHLKPSLLKPDFIIKEFMAL